jgi:hypothetical protein
MVLHGRNDGSFDAPRDVPAGPIPVAVAAADLDADGDVDLAVGTEVAGFRLLLGDGHGEFSSGGTVAPNVITSDLIAADVDADGIIDLLGTGSEINVVRGRGGGAFAPLEQFAGDVYAPLGVVDANGDRLPDLVSAGLGLGGGDDTRAGMFALRVLLQQR